MHRTKSKLFDGCGKSRISATTASWLFRLVAILTRDSDLSDPIMNKSGLTSKFLPFPHPTSTPTDPAGRDWRYDDIIGHGCRTVLVIFHTNMRRIITLYLVDEK